jgi:hypothetical protein
LNDTRRKINRNYFWQIPIHRSNEYFLNDRSQDWYEKIGKYIYENLGDHPLTKGEKGKRLYVHIAIFFITATLNRVSLTAMFGKPLLHSKFGEGVTGSKFSYASYFADINGFQVHVGWDNRGTSIYLPEDISSKEAYGIMLKLVDFYKEKVL